MKLWVTNMSKEAIPYAVGTTKYLIANEQVAMQAILQFLSFFYQWEEISTILSLGIFVSQIPLESGLSKIFSF